MQKCVRICEGEFVFNVNANYKSVIHIQNNLLHYCFLNFIVCVIVYHLQINGFTYLDNSLRASGRFIQPIFLRIFRRIGTFRRGN